MVVIYLSGSPGNMSGATLSYPIWPCSGWGLPSKTLSPRFLVVSYAAFSPLPTFSWRSIFCGTFPKVTLAWISQASCSYGVRTFLKRSITFCDYLPCLGLTTSTSGKYNILPHTSHRIILLHCVSFNSSINSKGNFTPHSLQYP